MNRLLFLLALLLQLTGVLCTVTTEGERKVLAGQSIVVPCPYSNDDTLNVKYWCQGAIKDFCTTLARTDQPDNAPPSNARITIADDQTQNVFTVTMRELKEADSGWYWCGVEVGGIWSKDSATSLYISVSQGISVEHNEISAEEGSSVSVKCVYSEKYREKQKRWCMRGHLDTCKSTNNGTFSSKSLLISDDGKDTVTVTMRQMEMRDAGWYFCGAGEHQMSVRVIVTPRSTTVASDVKTQHRPSEVTAQDSDSYSLWQPVLCVCCIAGLTLLTALFVTRTRIREKCMSKEKWRLESASVIFLNTTPSGPRFVPVKDLEASKQPEDFLV